MKCPKCQFENPEVVKFCVECGNKLEANCPKCSFSNLPNYKFCGECGYDLRKSTEPASLGANEHVTQISESAPEETISIAIPAEGERKHVTVLFSDISGYTAMAERLDPEEVKEITSRIFGEISKIVGKYDGFIEKYAGDAVMAIFGVPKAHEDDPIRAIKAAREIHETVDAVSPEVENRIGQTISMHTGINTGLVVTGEVDMERGTHGVAGDTINLASRLSNLAKTGEILIDAATYRQVEGHFTCEYLEETMVKGKADPVQVHKVLSQKEKPITIHRLSGLRADLIGRKAEIDELEEAVENLRDGKGGIFSICGDAGTGKSRLVEDFKATLDLEEIQWFEGHAYAYSQNMPYFPMIDLLNSVFQIQEDDSPENVREKVESGIEDLVGKKEDVAPYVGGLYSISYPEAEEVSPEFWRSRLQEAIHTILSALAKKAPTIFFLEDLHWADPSFVELLRRACQEIRQPAIVLCAYRPAFSLFTSHQLSHIGKLYHEIQLQDLSLSEAQDMLVSLLKTASIPSDLKRLVQNKAEGNPFYLEELVNSLIESETLIRDNGNWKITRSISESDISSTIHGLISARLDRLEKETKRILQEASVIGRTFLYEILKRITELEDRIDRGLSTLERLDLIRTRIIQPDLEYMFKHPITQEVVYNGLLKKERQEIHEQIALVMEGVFQVRLSEFYENLAFHFKMGRSIDKAIDYLMKSGEKSIKKYAVEESHQYYEEAFEILVNKSGMPHKEELLIDLLVKWALVFYYRGDFKGLTNLLLAHENLAASIDDKAMAGMYYAWLGFVTFFRGKLKESYRYLCKALELGEEEKDNRVIGYACTWLPWTCAALGYMEEAVVYGERAQEISKLLPEDHYLYFKSLAALGFTHHVRGDKEKVFEVGESLLDYSQKHSNIRCAAMSNWMMVLGYHVDGDFKSAVDIYEKAGKIAVDPFYSQMETLYLGVSYFLNDQLQEAESPLNDFITYSNQMGCETLGTMAHMLIGIISIAKGHMSQGLGILKEAKRLFIDFECPVFYAQSEYALGKVYSQIALGAGPKNLFTMAKNIGFIIKNAPLAAKKAGDHFEKAIELAKEIQAKGTLAQAYLDLGLLHKAKKRKDEAQECISEAIKIFEECKVEGFLKQAREALFAL